LYKLAEIEEPITIVRYRGSERIGETLPKYELVSTHTPRRTFVKHSLEKGIRAETVKAPVMQIIGLSRNASRLHLKSNQ
jgi:hypothetical protein